MTNFLLSTLAAFIGAGLFHVMIAAIATWRQKRMVQERLAKIREAQAEFDELFAKAAVSFFHGADFGEEVRQEKRGNVVYVNFRK